MERGLGILVLNFIKKNEVQVKILLPGAGIESSGIPAERKKKMGKNIANEV